MYFNTEKYEETLKKFNNMCAQFLQTEEELAV